MLFIVEFVYIIKYISWVELTVMLLSVSVKELEQLPGTAGLFQD